MQIISLEIMKDLSNGLWRRQNKTKRVGVGLGVGVEAGVEVKIVVLTTIRSIWQLRIMRNIKIRKIV